MQSGNGLGQIHVSIFGPENLVKSRNFSWTLSSVLFQTGAFRCLAKRPTHFPCNSHVFHPSVLSTSTMFFFFQNRAPQMLSSYSQSSFSHKPLEGPLFPTFWAAFMSNPQAKLLMTSPRMRATRRWWTSWNQFLGKNDPRGGEKKWSMGWGNSGTINIINKKVILRYYNGTSQMIINDEQ